jgi:Carboxypeptidase regulatory-like domain
MNRKMWKLVGGMGILALSLLSSNQIRAQVARAMLSGTVTDFSGKVAADAGISAKNIVSGQSTETRTDSAGVYNIPNLVPGDYEVSVSAEGFSTNVAKVTITQGTKQTMNLTLGGVLSLGDLGFSPAQTQGSAEDEARLNKRSHMLKIHQRLGMIDTKYDQVALQQTTQGNETRKSGTIPATLIDFKIDPPSLLSMPIKNEIPVRVEMTWQRQQ